MQEISLKNIQNNQNYVDTTTHSHIKNSNLFLKIAAVFVTAMEWLKGCFIKKNTTFKKYSGIGNISSAINQLHNRHGAFLGSSVVINFLEGLKLEKKNFAFSSNALLDNKNSKKELVEIFTNLKNENPRAEKFAIPIDNNGHHVVIFVDTKEKTIDYFDPRGATSSAPETNRGKYPDMHAELVKIKDSLDKESEEYSIRENTHQFQIDHHNCGVWGMWFISTRLNHSLNDTLNQKLSTENLKKFRMQECVRKIEIYFNNQKVQLGIDDSNNQGGDDF